MVTSIPVGKLPASLLQSLLERYVRPDPRVLVGPAVGQDAAIIQMGDRLLVAKSDPVTFASAEIGWYAVHINANDVACSGATPKWFLATLLLPEHTTTPALVEKIFAQVDQACLGPGRYLPAVRVLLPDEYYIVRVEPGDDAGDDRGYVQLGLYLEYYQVLLRVFLFLLVGVLLLSTMSIINHVPLLLIIASLITLIGRCIYLFRPKQKLQ